MEGGKGRAGEKSAQSMNIKKPLRGKARPYTEHKNRRGTKTSISQRTNKTTLKDKKSMKRPRGGKNKKGRITGVSLGGDRRKIPVKRETILVRLGGRDKGKRSSWLAVKQNQNPRQFLQRRGGNGEAKPTRTIAYSGEISELTSVGNKRVPKEKKELRRETDTRAWLTVRPQRLVSPPAEKNKKIAGGYLHA